MSKVLFKISDDLKILYFSFLQDKEVNMGEQNHQNQKLSAGSDMDLKPPFYLFILNVRSRGRVGGGGVETLEKVPFFF